MRFRFPRLRRRGGTVPAYPGDAAQAELGQINEALREAGFYHPVGAQGVRDLIAKYKQTVADLNYAASVLHPADRPIEEIGD
jgi:hypothetical protein